MTKVPGGFKPATVDAIRYILTNPVYIGAWVYDDAIVRKTIIPPLLTVNSSSPVITKSLAAISKANRYQAQSAAVCAKIAPRRC